jgi:antitoxin YefM
MFKVSLHHARENLKALIDQATAGETIVIKRRGKQDVALVAKSELTGLAETIHLLSSPANAKRLLKALARSKKTS